MMHKIEIVNVTLATLLLYYIKFLALLGNTQVWWKVINDLKGLAREILEKFAF